MYLGSERDTTLAGKTKKRRAVQAYTIDGVQNRRESREHREGEGGFTSRSGSGFLDRNHETNERVTFVRGGMTRMRLRLSTVVICWNIMTSLTPADIAYHSS